MRLPSFRSESNKKLGVLASAVLLVPLMSLNVGCTGDRDPNGFIDPTAVGRWKSKALVVPVLDKLDVGVEEPNEEFVQATDVRPEDLNQPAQDYRISPNDALSITISDLLGPGVESRKDGRVTESGKISLPAVGQVQAAGMTEAELERAITQAYREAKLIENAQVTVTVTEPRGKTFNIIGAVPRAGEYPILNTDFRMLNALITAGDAYPGSDYAYVIRKVNRNAPTGAATQPAPAGQPITPGLLEPGATTTTPNPANALDPNAGQSPATTPPPPATPPAPAPEPATPAPPAPAPAPNNGNAPGGGAAEDGTNTSRPATATTTTAPGLEPEGRVIMLDGRAKAIAAPGTDTSATGTATPSATDSVTVDTTTTANAESPATTQSFEFNTPAGVGEYRQIRVPLAELRNGSLKYNIVIQPGDMIVIPGPQTGEYYVGGHVNRPGVYVMTGRKITLKQAIVSAGMFDQVAVPERTEIIRRLPGNKEVYARVNLDRVFSGEDPEIYLKPNDVLNVGTSIWAPFVAAVRNAFRFTYGFGFIYDKNFNTDTRTNGR